MKIISTICSKKKDESKELLPAHLRYLAPHIQETYKKSKDSNLPMYIFSGLYGFVASDEPIPYYDYYLEQNKVDELTKTLAEQIKNLGITEIYFYREDKETWRPYIEAIEKGATEAGCILHKETLFLEPLTPALNDVL